MAVGNYEIARKLALSGKGPLGLTGKYLRYYKELRLAMLYNKDDVQRLIQRTERKPSPAPAPQESTPEIFKTGTKISGGPQAVSEFFEEKTKTSDISQLNAKPKVPVELLNKYKREQEQRQQFGTIERPTTPQKDITIKTTPYVEERPTGETYRGIPIVEYIYVNPDVIGKQQERPATPQEIQQFQEQKKATALVQISKEKPSRLSKSQTFQNIAGQWEQIKSEPFIGTEKERKSFETKAINVLSPVVGTKTASFTVGVGSALIPWTKGELVKDIAIYGASAGVGSALRLTEIGAVKVGSKISKLSFAPKAFKVGEFATGTALTGVYAYNVGESIYTAPSYYEKGKIIGGATKDISLVSFGLSRGQRVADIFVSERAVRDRIEIPIEKLEPPEILSKEITFPRTKTVKQEFEAFANNKYNLPIKKVEGYGKSERLVYYEEYKNLPFKVPGAGYHVTPNVFWEGNKGVITPAPGTSELPGLFLSYAPSLHFAKLGSENVRLFPRSFKELFTPRGVPGIANIQPKGFRINPAVPSVPYTLEGSKKIFKLGFKKPVKKGFADIPLNKLGGESQAILRVESGNYKVINEEFYTEYEGIPLKIDQFKYEDIHLKIREKEVRTERKLKLKDLSSEYSIPTYSLITPTSVGFASSIDSYKKSSKSNQIYRLKKYSSTSYKATTTSISKSPPLKKALSYKKAPTILKKSLVQKSIIKKYSLSNILSPKQITQQIPKTTPKGFFKLRGAKQTKPIIKKYPVLIRRFGKFRVVGYGRTPMEAITIGKSIVGRTLARTFTIKGTKPSKVKGFRTKKEKKGLVFIEPSKRALSTKSELAEIFHFRKLKGGYL